MSWEIVHAVCPKCNGLRFDRFVAYEANAPTTIVDKHSCGWEKIYKPELLYLVEVVEGRKMDWTKILPSGWEFYVERVKNRNLNAYEILGRAIVYFIALLSVSILAFTWLEGMLSFPRQTGWPAEAIIPLNLLGAFTIYKYVLIQSTNKKEK